jgi:L-lactate dehydrogenase complex protein LldG
MSDRATILSRVRSALADVPADEAAAWDPLADDDAAAAYLRAGAGARPQELADLFEERCGAYRARVIRCADDAAAIAAAVRDACARHDVVTLAVPASLDAAWRPEGAELLVDEPPLSVARLDGCDGVLTGCALAIAVTGTIVLDAGARQGRRVVTLVPDLHICVVRAAQLVHGVPDAFALLGAPERARRPITFISGPSATSDIELSRVEGVHGPRRLEVILAA